MTKRKTTSPLKATTQDFIEIEDVRDDVVLLKDNSCCVIIEVGTTNFGLLSEEEQRSMIYSFGSLLNSLSFPVQIVVLSRKMDISSYLDFLDERIRAQANEVVKKRLSSYTEFIKNVVKNNTVLGKSFYFVVPFSPLKNIFSREQKPPYILKKTTYSAFSKKRDWEENLFLIKK